MKKIKNVLSGILFFLTLFAGVYTVGYIAIYHMLHFPQYVLEKVKDLGQNEDEDDFDQNTKD